VGIIVGEGVVGDGVDIGLGKGVGDGVGPHVVHSNNRSTSTPPETKVVANILHSYSPIGGVKSHSPVLSSVTA